MKLFNLLCALATILVAIPTFAAANSSLTFTCNEDVAGSSAWTVTYKDDQAELSGEILLFNEHGDSDVQLTRVATVGKQFPAPIGEYRGSSDSDALYNYAIIIDSIDVENSDAGQTWYKGTIYKFNNGETDVKTANITCYGHPLGMKF